MHILYTEIDAELADALEAYFAEEEIVTWGIETAPNAPLILKGFYESREEAEADAAALARVFPAIPTPFAYQEMEDREWQDAYKAFLKPWSTGHLHWVPAWERETYPLPEGHVAIYLDAGMAFGTGSHETTRLMARRMMDFLQARGNETFAEAQIVDAGCGSGILALSAVKLGAKHVFGFDQDGEAIRVSWENAEINGISRDEIDFATTGIEGGLAGRKIDFMMANIQADILKIHAEGLFSAMAPGGKLALSGILARELEEVKASFRFAAKQIGVNATEDSRTDGEWSDLCYSLV